MDEPILCLALLFVLGWVIYLKLQVAQLKQQIERLSGTVRKYIKEAKSEAETGDDQAVWGERPKWIK